jgi:molybdopterin synthase catalytic subunit
MPHVNVRLFASLREMIGERDITMDLPDGATVGQLRDQLADRYPIVRAFLPTLVCAVGEEYVPVEHVLREGDFVAVIPPVSGGSRPLFVVTADPLDPAALAESVRRDDAGAIALFYGIVRNENLGRRVQYLEYDAYPEMAIKKMKEVAAEVRAKFPIAEVGAMHRTGRLEIGETSLLVAVSSGHRKEAFEACHYAVDRIKQIVPVWKKEVWEDGSEWIEGNVPDIRPASETATS